MQNDPQKIAILLCTYNGESFLEKQLDSIAMQSYSHWEVHASDDNSTDATMNILKMYQNKWGHNRFVIHRGPAQGFSQNFFTLINNAHITANYYAYCDQDDIWQTDKLERAVCHLNNTTNNNPALYCTRKLFIDETGQELGYSHYYKKKPSFANALVQNISSGNTMVINNAARILLQDTSSAINVYAHDWWTYLIITGCGGEVFYDEYPSVHYRQHNSNLIGGSTNLLAKWKRIKMLFDGSFKEWNNRNISALFINLPKLTYENRVVLRQFNTSRNQWLIPRIVGFNSSGVYRQTLLENIGLKLAMFFKKL